MCSQGLFIFGLGYSTTGVARLAHTQGWTVTSTSRQPARFTPLQTPRHTVVRFDPASRHYLDGEGRQALQSPQYVLTSIPPVAAKLYDPVLAAQFKALQQAVDAGAAPAGLGYLSSTGVYGDWGGDWVDERSEPRTATARGLLRLEAELAWTDLAQRLELPLTIFRLGGIYGPRRSVLDNLRLQGPPSASAVRRSRQRFTSRCHVADVAQAVLADVLRRTQQQQQHRCQAPPAAAAGAAAPVMSVSVASTAGGLVDIINVVDDAPAPRADVEAFAQQLLLGGGTAHSSRSSGSSGDGRQESQVVDSGQQQEQQQQTPQKRTGQSEPLEEKRVRNLKLKQLLAAELGAQLQASTYKEGLALIAGQQTPFEPADLACLFHTEQGLSS